MRQIPTAEEIDRLSSTDIDAAYGLLEEAYQHFVILDQDIPEDYQEVHARLLMSDFEEFKKASPPASP